MSMLTIYSLGDHESIRAALTGVAMIFDPAKEMLGGAGILGLGHFAGFGLLVSFMFVAAGIIFRQKLEFEQIIIVGIAYAALFVPKTTVTIEDMHTGQVAVVDNVPIGVAYPGGIISAFTHSVAVTLEQVMRSASSEYLPQTDVGFVAPLKLMLAARNAVTGDPYFQKNYSYFLADCVIPGVDAKAAAQVNDPQDFFGAVISSASSAGAATLYFSSANNEGDVRSCDSVASQLRNDFATVFSGIDSSLDGSSQMSSVEGRINAVADKKISSSPLAKHSIADLAQSVETLTTAGVSSQKVMNTLVLGDITYNTFRCGKAGTSDYITCTAAQAQAMEQYKFDAAGQASMVQKTMIPSMNIFMFFFYAFAPMIAIIIAMSGIRGIVKVLPSYLLFGVWTQSWIPAAAIINYFIQKQVQEAIVGRLVRGDGIPLSNLMELYHTLTLKIAAASELLAYTPMLTLALLSGSMFALTKLADGGKDKFDEKTMAPDHLKVSETGSVQPRNVKAPNLTDSGLTDIRGRGGDISASANDPVNLVANSSAMSQLASATANELAQVNAHTESLVQDLSQAFGEDIAAAIKNGNGTSTVAGLNKHSGRSAKISSSIDKALQSTSIQKLMTDLGIDTKTLSNVATSGVIGGGGNASAGMTAAMSFLKKLISSTPNLRVSGGAMNDVSEAVKNGLVAVKDDVEGVSADYRDQKMSSEETSLANTVTSGNRKSLGKKIDQHRSRSRSLRRTATETDSVSNSSGVEIKYNAKALGEIAATRNEGDRFIDSLKGILADMGKTEEDALKAVPGGMYTGAKDQDARLAAGVGMLVFGSKDKQMGQRLIAAAYHAQTRSTVAVGSTPKAPNQDYSNVKDEVGEAKLMTPEEVAKMLPSFAAAEAAAGNAANATASVGSKIKSRGGKAKTGVTESDYGNYKQQVKDDKNVDKVHAANASKAMGFSGDAEYKAASAKVREKFMNDAKLSSLSKEFGGVISNDPALQLAYAAGGAGAVLGLVNDIKGLVGGNSGKVGAVLGKLANKVPGFVTKAAGRTLAAAAVSGPVGVAVGTAFNVHSLASAIKESYDEVMSEQGAPQKVAAGLTGSDPMGYIQQTYSGGAAPAGNQGGGSVAPQGATSSAVPSTTPSTAVTPKSDGGGGKPNTPAPSDGGTNRTAHKPVKAETAPAPVGQQGGARSGSETGNPGEQNGGAGRDKPAAPAPSGENVSKTDPTPLEAAQRVVDGLTGSDPMGYIQQTYSGGAAPAGNQGGGSVAPQGATSSAVPSTTPSTAVTPKSDGGAASQSLR